MVREQALDDPGLVHRQVSQSGIAIRSALRVEQRRGAEPLDEPPQLARRDRLAAEIDEVDFEAALLEEADRGPGCLIFLEPEDLDSRRGRGRSHDAQGSDRTGPLPGTIDPTGGARVTVWFTVKLDDRPGALARMATALAERGVNIAGIVGIAEDTNGELMLETSDPAVTRETFESLGLAYEAHDADVGGDPGRMSIADITSR